MIATENSCGIVQYSCVHRAQELDEVELPHTRYGDQELPDAAVVSNPSTDYCSAVSEMPEQPSRDSGHQLSPELPHSTPVKMK